MLRKDAQLAEMKLSLCEPLARGDCAFAQSFLLSPYAGGEWNVFYQKNNVLKKIQKNTKRIVKNTCNMEKLPLYLLVL